MPEKYESPAAIAKRFGLATEYVRQACYRQTGNTLNCLNVKRKKDGPNFFKIRPSEFEAWLEREEAIA